MAVRALLLCLAFAAIAVGASSLRTDHRCAEAKRALPRATGAGLVPAATAVADRCGDPRDRATADVLLLARGRRGDALALARRMTRDNPDDYVGWIAVYRLAGDRGALRRARELNPRGAPRD
jgi:hypothetical protein